MGIQIWEKTVIAWINSISNCTPIKSITQINELLLKDLIRKSKSDFENGVVAFLKEIFPNLTNDDSFKLSSSLDHLCAATLILIHVAFSKSTELDGLREIMCTKLDNSSQLNITEFLLTIQDYEDVFNLSFTNVKEEIYNFVERNPSSDSVIGDSVKTPVKHNLSENSFGSPLQGFFQTPKRNQTNNKKNFSSNLCGDGDHIKLIKKLTNQLIEEELEKASLQEQLNSHTQKLNEYEIKLRNKIEEINHLKSEWENESKKNETEFKSLKNNFLKKLEEEKKFKSELSHLENYITTLEVDLSNSVSDKNQLELQLKSALDKCIMQESQLKEISEMNLQLQKIIDNKEKELVLFKEEFIKQYKEEKVIDMSYMDGSFDTSMNPPESMEVVINKLLEEKNEENASLKETLEELEKEKINLYHEIKLVQEQLNVKSLTISELEFLNKELSAKVENFDLTEKELLKIQTELNNANTEINKLMKENFHLNEKFNSLNSSLQEREQALINCENSKMLLHMNFFKLAEDFKTVQQRLELEIKNISRLTLDTKENFLKLERSLAMKEISEVKELSVKQNHTFANDINYCTESMKSLDKIKEHHSNSSSIFEDKKLDKLNELLEYFENHHIEWSESKILMQNTCSQLNDSLIILKMKINELENNYKKCLEEKTELEKYCKKSEEKISEIESLHNYEIKKLNEELEVRDVKIKELQLLLVEFEKMEGFLLFKNETLKKDSIKLAKNIEVGFIHEGGDFNLQKSTFENELNVISKIETTTEQQDLSDSLEEVPVCNKTFDIVNLEEKNIGNKTFSVQQNKSSIGKKSASAWIVSPPPKIPTENPSKDNIKRSQTRSVQGEHWIVPVTPIKSKEIPQKLSSSVNDLTLKIESEKAEISSNLTKSSSLSSVLEVDFFPLSTIPSKSSAASSFFSAKESTDILKEKESYDTSQDIQLCKHALNVLPDVFIQKTKSLEHCTLENFTVIEKNKNILKEIPNGKVFNDDLKKNHTLEIKNLELQNEVVKLKKEGEDLRSMLLECEHKRKKDKETFEKNQEIIRQNIASKYENQLEHLKNEMKLLHNRELSKHKAEQSKISSELREQNRRYKEHIDELRNQLWDLGEKLLQEQKLKRDLERNYNELKKKYENIVYFRDADTKVLHGSEIHTKENLSDPFRTSGLRQVSNTALPIMPTEDEDEVFDNRFLEDMKTGLCKVERPEGRLMELQYRNSLCLPHLKSSYPGETQFHNPALFKENDLKLGLLQFAQESQSLTDSDHSMTRSLIPENKGKKKEQTSYKRPGPPTPSKNGGRLSMQSGDLRLTPKNVLKELNNQSERVKGTPKALKILLSKSDKTGSLGSKDENGASVVTPRKKSKFFRKPFGARDH